MSDYVPLISGFVGALIGAAASIVTILIQSRIHDRRERWRMAVNIALEDYKLHIGTLTKSGQPATFLPLVTYLHYYLALMELIEKGTVTAESVAKLSRDNEHIIQKIKETNDNRKSS